MTTRSSNLVGTKTANCSIVLILLCLCLPGNAAAQAQPELPEPLQEVFRSGVAAQKAGRLDEAEAAFKRVLRAGGKLAFVYNNLGIIYQQRGDQGRAISQFREAIRIQPDYPAPHILLGSSLLALGQVPEASRELERAVKLAPGEPLARLELATAYERSGNLFGMVAELRSLCELAPREPEYSYQLRRAYMKMADWSVSEINRLNPQSVRFYQVLAESYRAQGNLEPALLALKRAAQIDPKLPGIHLAMAEIHLDRAEMDDARREIEQELALVPESVAAKTIQQRILATHPKR